MTQLHCPSTEQAAMCTAESTAINHMREASRENEWYRGVEVSSLYVS